MESLALSALWVPAYELVAKIRKEEKKIKREAVKAAKKEGIEEGKERGRQEGKKEGKREGEKNKAIKIARKMLLKGVKVADIVDFTGLSKAQITKLSKTKKKK